MMQRFACRDLPALPKGKGSFPAVEVGKFAYFDHGELTKKKSDRGLWSIMTLPAGALVVEAGFRSDLAARRHAQLFDAAYRGWWFIEDVQKRVEGVALPHSGELSHFRDWVEYFESQLLEEREAYRDYAPQSSAAPLALSKDELADRLRALSARRRQV